MFPYPAVWVRHMANISMMIRRAAEGSRWLVIHGGEIGERSGEEGWKIPTEERDNSGAA